MKALLKRVVQGTLVVGLATSLTGTLLAQESEPVGIVRISKMKSSEAAGDQVTPVSAAQFEANCNTSVAPPAGVACDPSASAGSGFGSGSGTGSVVSGNGGSRRAYRKYARQDWRYSDWQADNSWGSSLHRRTQRHSLALENAYGRTTGHTPSMYYHDPSGQAMLDYFKCKFGYFCPSGGDGSGLPWVGCYGRVYPVDPYSTDSRDGQVWAAQGYGIPISVPLAPVVGHTYEYGWGVPSSRLVPVSHPAY